MKDDSEFICERCGKPGTGQRPNPGESQPNYVWYFDNEDAAEKGLADDNIPYGPYHLACHDQAAAEMSPADKKANFDTEAAKYRSA